MNRVLLNIFLSILFSFLILIVIFPKITNAQTMDCNSGFDEIFTDITYKSESVTVGNGQNVSVHVVKANLSTGNLDLLVTPRDDLGTRTSDFMVMHSAVVAVNGDYHYPPPPEWDPLGNAASEGDRYSQNPDTPTIYISEENEVTFFNRGGNPLWDAISGAHSLLVGSGQMSTNIALCPNNDDVYCRNRHSRTTIGIRGEELTLMVVDGDITLREITELLMECSVRNAINMDGGGSSTLASTSEDDFLLNNPGLERVVANHFGICLGSCSTGGPVLPPITLPSLVSGIPRPRYGSVDPYPFPCNRIAPNDALSSEDEFHSLRPYQASPCNPNKEDLALFCGNSLTVVNEVTVTKTFSPNRPFDATYSLPPEPPPPSDLYTCQGMHCREPNACSDFLVQCAGCEWCACWPTNNGENEVCSFIINESRSIAVDVSGAELPIMGYTEPSQGNEDLDKPQVINSVFQEDETLTLNQRVNEYVSWYLNGVNERAEYPPLDVEKECIGEWSGVQGTCKSFLFPSSCNITGGLPPPAPLPFWQFDGKGGCAGLFNYCCLNTELDPQGELLGRDQLINYSGPIKKLLPSRIQNEVRLDEIEDANESRRDNAGIRHDQTAGCIRELDLESIGIDQGIGGAIIPCYLNDFWNRFLTFIGARDEIHLSEWLVPPTRSIVDYDPEWTRKVPPTEEGASDNEAFLRQYKDWRGMSCFYIPIFNRSWSFCFDNPFNVNYWSSLYTRIPFSSMEDRLGEVAIRDYTFQPPLYSDFTILSLVISNIQNADLFFPHMEESDDLGEILQQTYAPLGADLDNMTDATYLPPSAYCDYTTIRTNPGDDLFAGELSADIEYSARMTCEFLLAGEGRLCEVLLNATCTDPPPPGTDRCPADYGELDCTFESDADTDPAPGGFCIRSPDDCVSQVDTRGSNCEREFGGVCIRNSWAPNCRFHIPTPDPPGPQILCNGGYTCVRESSCVRPQDDIPPLVDSCTVEIFVTLNLETRTPLADRVWARFVAGSMSVFRRIFPKVDEGGAVEEIWDIPTATGVIYTDVSDPPGVIFTGDPRYRIPGSNASLFFPHIGGIREYFMTGIQTILRPKGYGDQILSNVTRVTPPPGPPGPPGGTSGTGSCDVYSRADPVPPPSAGGSSATCTPPVAGWCQPTRLHQILNSFPGRTITAREAELLAIICMRESGGATNALNDCCIIGATCDFSIGLFQINALPGRCDPHYNSSYPYEAAFTGGMSTAMCSQAGDWRCTWNPTTSCCIPHSEEAAYQCIDYWSHPMTNLEKVARMFRDNGFCPWNPGVDYLCGVNYSSC